MKCSVSCFSSGLLQHWLKSCTVVNAKRLSFLILCPVDWPCPLCFILQSPSEGELQLESHRPQGVLSLLRRDEIAAVFVQNHLSQYKISILFSPRNFSDKAELKRSLGPPSTHAILSIMKVAKTSVLAHRDPCLGSQGDWLKTWKTDISQSELSAMETGPIMQTWLICCRKKKKKEKENLFVGSCCSPVP